ncbi:MAG: SRPBCC family protein [Chloroflexota bacterium]
MSVHKLNRDQFIPESLENVWSYFCDPYNLNEMTPPDMNFEIITNPLVKMFEGQMIEYRVEFIKGLRSIWITEIAHVLEKSYFVDEQRIGPYRFWYHQHFFESVTGGTRMVDDVTYSIGYGLAGKIMNDVWIKNKLEYIFNFRAKKINVMFQENR